jgi:hypothetical protein
MEPTARENVANPPSPAEDPRARLSERVKQAIRNGRLPTAFGKGTVWGGQGCGTLCDVCAQRIAYDDLEIEVILSSPPFRRVLHLHVKCEQLWQEVSTRHPDSVYQSHPL